MLGVFNVFVEAGFGTVYVLIPIIPVGWWSLPIRGHSYGRSRRHNSEIATCAKLGIPILKYEFHSDKLNVSAVSFTNVIYILVVRVYNIMYTA